MAAAAVLNKQDVPVRATNPSHFAKRNHWVGNSAQTERVYDGVEALIGEGECLRIHDQEIDIETQPRRPLSGELQHCGAQIHSGDVAGPWVIREVFARSDCNLENLSGCLLQGFLRLRTQ